MPYPDTSTAPLSIRNLWPSLVIGAAPPSRWQARLISASLSGRAHGVEESADLGLEAVRVARQRLRRGEHLRGCRSGFAGAALHVGDIGTHLLGALRRLLH